jgi:arylsulfatase A-like enzyme
VIHQPVSLRDIAATIADLAYPSSGPPFPGRSLARFWNEQGRPSERSAEALLSELDGPPEADPNHGSSPACRGPLRSIVRGDWHYIRSGDGSEEIYDLASDPRELRNLARSPESVATLQGLRNALRAIER